MPKLTWFFLLLISISYNAVSQNTNQFSWIKNSTIQYNFIRTSMRLIGKDSLVPSKYIITVGLTSKKKQTLKKLSKDEWLNLLNNPDTDWAANILLYSLSEKDALVFFAVIKTKPDWDKCCRTDDIKYWSATLPALK